MSNTPGPIADDAPDGHQAEIETKVTRSRLKRKKTVKVIVDFDNNLQEFLLWDFIYDSSLDSVIYSLESSTDWINRNQIYDITAKTLHIRKLMRFLKKNEFLFHLTKN